VTTCTFDRLEIFGSVEYDRVELSTAGDIVQEEWWVTEKLRKRVLLDEFVVMPNHIHGILAIRDDLESVGGRVAPTSPCKSRLFPNSLGSIVGQFKSQCTKRIRKRLNQPNLSVWQRNYHEHIIRNDRELRGFGNTSV
jgi:REP element-mobilizing transposase RayT